MTKRPISLTNQSVELDKLVMLERFRRRNSQLPESLIEQGLTQALSKRIARALDGKIDSSELNEREAHYVRQVRTLA